MAAARQRQIISRDEHLCICLFFVLAYRLEGISISNTSHEELTLISKLKLCLPTIDTVGLSTHLISSQSLTKWFESLERLIKYSVAKRIFQLFDKRINEQLEEILFNQTSINSKENEYPLQIVLLVEHILFGLILQKQIEKKAKLFIRNLKFVFLPKTNF
jgi:hypothetical protein